MPPRLLMLASSGSLMWFQKDHRIHINPAVEHASGASSSFSASSYQMDSLKSVNRLENFTYVGPMLSINHSFASMYLYRPRMSSIFARARWTHVRKVDSQITGLSSSNHPSFSPLSLPFPATWDHSPRLQRPPPCGEESYLRTSKPYPPAPHHPPPSDLSPPPLDSSSTGLSHLLPLLPLLRWLIAASAPSQVPLYFVDAFSRFSECYDFYWAAASIVKADFV